MMRKDKKALFSFFSPLLRFARNDGRGEAMH